MNNKEGISLLLSSLFLFSPPLYCCIECIPSPSKRRRREEGRRNQSPLLFKDFSYLLL